MDKFSIFLIFVSFSIISFIEQGDAVNNKNHSKNSAEKYDPLLVVSQPSLPLKSIYVLPPDSKLLEYYENEEWRLAKRALDNFSIVLCPELRTNDQKAEIILETLNEVFSDSEKCLFVRNFESNEHISYCKREPKISLEVRKQNDGSPVTCGVNDQQRLIDAQYYNCGSDLTLSEYAEKVIYATQKGIDKIPQFEPIRYHMYEICYDFQRNQTLWTKYNPMAPPLIANGYAEFHGAKDIDIKDFSTDTSSLNLSSTILEKLKTSYLLTKPDITSVYTMVPKNHMALRYWKTATSHMLNSAPILPELIPIIRSINDGIFKASSNLFTTSQKILKIYTKADTEVIPMMNFVSSFDTVEGDETHLKPKKDAQINLFKPNIWYKFVYDDSEKSGVLIVFHNTNEELPKQKECSDDEILHCDFKKWSLYSNWIPDKRLNHVYCCQVSQKRIKQLFSINELQLDKSFNIEEVINPTKEESQNLSENDKNL